MKSLLLIYLLFPVLVGAQTLLIPQGANWQYFDQGNVSDSAWNTRGFNASNWRSGPSQLGYGEGDENTVIGYGPNPNKKYVTSYFRHEFNVETPEQYAHLNLNLLYDDGAVVYLNGVEVWRSNMKAGTITDGTQAAGLVVWPFENDWFSLNISASYLQEGNNVIAVEIHQESPTSSDLSFNFFMMADEALPAQVIRGPYLQQATESSVIIRWRTNVATDSRVNFGLQTEGLTTSIINPAFTTDHSLKITGLSPQTMYAYSIGSYSNVIMQTPNLFFETLPEFGEEGSYQFVVLGDCGSGRQEQLDVKRAVIHARGNHFDGVILLGDNAYQSGFDANYQDNFFTGQYNEIIENTVIWPCPGNHDYNNHLPFSPSPAYFDIFDCPTKGESGGVPSGTEKYYSFDHGNVHFISLDSYDEPRSASATMAQWLRSDLRANTLEWVVVFFHHPPYTKGSHDSDNDNFLDGQLVDMREEIVPILEDYDVDLVLNGHSHAYERTFLISDHVGDSDSFGQEHIKMNGSGNYPTQCPYQKSSTNGVHDGTVYCVAGNAGKTSKVDSDWPHPAMVSYHIEPGALFLDVNKNRLDLTFLNVHGLESDHFTIVKDAGGSQEVLACINEPITLYPTWPSDAPAIWSPGGQADASYTISAQSNTTIYTVDAGKCISDTFHLVILQNDSCGFLGFDPNSLKSNGLSASYADGVITIVQEGDHFFEHFELYDRDGKRLLEFNVGDRIHQEQLEKRINGLFLLKPKETNYTFKLYCHE